jgi:hypothetical protein
MPENNNPKQHRGVTLRTPADVRRLVQRLASSAFQEGTELENAGRISQLLSNWLAAWRLEKEDGEWQAIQERLALIERAQAIEAQNKAQSAKEFNENLQQLKILVKELE